MYIDPYKTSELYQSYSYKDPVTGLPKIDEAAMFVEDDVAYVRFSRTDVINALGGSDRKRFGRIINALLHARYVKDGPPSEWVLDTARYRVAIPAWFDQIWSILLDSAGGAGTILGFEVEISDFDDRIHLVNKGT